MLTVVSGYSDTHTRSVDDMNADRVVYSVVSLCRQADKIFNTDAAKLKKSVYRQFAPAGLGYTVYC